MRQARRALGAKAIVSELRQTPVKVVRVESVSRRFIFSSRSILCLWALSISSIFEILLLHILLIFYDFPRIFTNFSARLLGSALDANPVHLNFHPPRYHASAGHVPKSAGNTGQSSDSTIRVP
jgi:hypothetical protein